MKFLTSLFLAFAISAQAAPLTNTVTFNWLDFGYQVDSVTNKPVKITPLEYATIGSFFMVKTPRIYTNTFAGQCIVTNWQEGSYRVELATALGSITTFTSTIPSTATGSSNYDATSFVTNYATNSGSTRSYSITVSDLRYPSVAGTNIVFTTNSGRVTIAGTVVTGTSPAVASNYLAVTKLDITNGTAYALTVSGLFSSTNMDAKISSASNTVHTALIATNTLLFTNIFSLNTAANNNAANVTSISNRVIQAEVTNAVQQTALAGLTNSIANLNTNYIATTNGMSRGLTNLGQAYSDRLTVTNLIVGTNANTVQITNGTIIATGDITASNSTFNGNITNFGRYISTNRLTLSRPANIGQSNQIFTDVCDANGSYNSLYVTAGNSGNSRFHIGRTGSTFYGVDFHSARLESVGAINSSFYQIGNGGSSSSVLSDNASGVANFSSYWQTVIRARVGNIPATAATTWNGSSYTAYGVVIEGQDTTTPAFTIAPKTNTVVSPFTIERGLGSGLTTKIYEVNTNGVPISPSAMLSASTPFTAPDSLGIQGAHLWSDGTNLCIVLQNSAGTRTTNKVTMTAWP